MAGRGRYRTVIVQIGVRGGQRSTVSRRPCGQGLNLQKKKGRPFLYIRCENVTIRPKIICLPQAQLLQLCPHVTYAYDEQGHGSSCLMIPRPYGGSILMVHLYNLVDKWILVASFLIVSDQMSLHHYIHDDIFF